MIFYLIRHGDPIYDPDSLTPLGHQQAEALSKRLALYGLDEIYASSSIRAQMTAKPTCDALGKEMKILDWANEGYAMRDFGAYRENGEYTWSFFIPKMIEAFHSPEMYALGQEWYKHPCCAGLRMEEGIKRIHREVDELFLSLGYKHDRTKGGFEVLKPNPKRVALMAHQGFGLAFLSSVLDIPYPLVCTRFDLGHSSVSVIQFRDDDGDFIYPKALQLSNDSHLYKEGIMTGYNNQVDI